MANITEQIFKKKYENKVVTVQEFRERFAQNISTPAVRYLCEKNIIDFAIISPEKGKFVRLIILTEKTLAYTPNKNYKREILPL